jgi:ABC-type glycerol-3-phosphate transport system permease component
MTGADRVKAHSASRLASGPGEARAMLYITLLVIGAVMLVPILVLVATSLMTPAAASNPYQWLPRAFVWSNYRTALQQMDFYQACANSLLVTGSAVVVQVVVCSLVGLGFARYRFKGRGQLFAMMLATMMIPPQVTMIPVFILFRSASLIDTFWPLILNSFIASPFFIFMFRQFFRQVPANVIEAARLDGASPLGIYWRLMLPLSKPVVAVVAIQTFMFTWNDFIGPLIYLHSAEKRTLPVALSNFIGQYGVQHPNLLMAGSLMMLAPCVGILLIGQRYLVTAFTQPARR